MQSGAAAEVLTGTRSALHSWARNRLVTSSRHIPRDRVRIKCLIVSSAGVAKACRGIGAVGEIRGIATTEDLDSALGGLVAAVRVHASEWEVLKAIDESAGGGVSLSTAQVEGDAAAEREARWAGGLRGPALRSAMVL